MISMRRSTRRRAAERALEDDDGEGWLSAARLAVVTDDATMD